MDIEVSDFLDWEPLHIRFLFPTGSSERDVQAAKAFLEEWFERNTERLSDDVELRYWNVCQQDEVTIAVDCERMTEKGVERLAEAMAREFPPIIKLILGVEAGALVPSEIVWHRVETQTAKRGAKEEAVKPVHVSVFHISIEQYCEFLEKSGYVPSHCLENETDDISIFERAQIASAGKAFLQHPVTMIRLSDAEAFCGFMHCRLPTELELFAFFHSYLANGAEFPYTNDNWTSSRKSATQQIVIGTPWKRSEIQSFEKMTRVVDPDDYGYPFPSFRVCRD
jgi:hypothetical protein